MRKVKIGIIGAGGICTVHLPPLKERSEEVELVAAADVNPAAKALVDKYEIPQFFSDYRQLLPLVDAVLINVPTHLHASMTIEALKADKHVFLEKPMTRTLDEAKEVAAAAAQSKGRLQIGFVRRFDDEWEGFRQAILAGELGRPVTWRHVATSCGPQIRWFTEDLQGGGPFLDGAIHNYDFGMYTFGPVQWVFAHLRTNNPQYTAFDTGTATVHFESGDELMVAWTWGLPPGCVGGGCFDFLGPRGTLLPRADLPADAIKAQFTIHHGKESRTVESPRRALEIGYKRQMNEFVDVALGKCQPRAGVREGMESMRVALAILQSGKTGNKVHLSEIR
jgi:predicted dehydrogenase